MKRTVIIMAGIASAAISCTKTEFLERPEASVIRFENAFVDKLTKADVTSTSLTSFVAFAKTAENTTVLNAAEVTRSGSTWEYEGEQLWNPQSTYSFAAYGPSEACEAISGINHDWKSNTLTFDYNSDSGNQHDLVLAEKRTDGYQTALDLDFRHLTSIVYFVFRSEEGSSITFNINSLTVSGINTTARFNGTSFENHSTPGTYPMFAEEGSACTMDADATSNEIYVIPQSLEEGEVVMHLDVNATDTFGNVLTYNDDLQIALPAIDWKASQTYVITTDLNVNDINPEIKVYKIEFGAEVNDWADGGTAEI